MEMTGISRSSVYRLVQENKFPKPGRLTPALLDRLLNPVFNIGRNPSGRLFPYFDRLRKIVIGDPIVNGTSTKSGQFHYALDRKQFSHLTPVPSPLEEYDDSSCSDCN